MKEKETTERKTAHKRRMKAKRFFRDAFRREFGDNPTVSPEMYHKFNAQFSEEKRNHVRKRTP